MFILSYSEGNVNQNHYDISFKTSVANVYIQTMFFKKLGPSSLGDFLAIGLGFTCSFIHFFPMCFLEWESEKEIKNALPICKVAMLQPFSSITFSGYSTYTHMQKGWFSSSCASHLCSGPWGIQPPSWTCPQLSLFLEVSLPGFLCFELQSLIC